MAADLDVMNLFIIAGGTLAIPILAFLASFLLWPSALIKVYYWYWRRTLGLQVRFADCGGYRFCYSCRGKPGMRPSILMLHGFSAHKDTWLTVVKYLPKHLHIVCVDMPGHEGTTRTNMEDYSIDGQVQRIRQFVQTIRLNRKPFHLVGTAMGGNVAGVYAACFPSEVCSMTLICPDGQSCCQFSDLEHSNYTLSIPLIPTTPEEMEDMFRLCSHVRYKIPYQILQGLVDVRQPHNTFYQEVFLEIIGEKSRYALQEHLQQIKAPLQVIWGKQDQSCIPMHMTLIPVSFCPGGGCVWSSGDFRDVAWMQSRSAGELWTLCCDGETLSDRQTHPGLHHPAAKCQEWHKEILLS
uniref:Abhydrolase domain containing 6b n=1 Tax=Salarias fasciatus TaxID=181472 RepID=A0A672HW68_SALFA